MFTVILLDKGLRQIGVFRKILRGYLNRDQILSTISALISDNISGRGGTVHVFVLNRNGTGVTVRCINFHREHAIKINKTRVQSNAELLLDTRVL